MPTSALPVRDAVFWFDRRAAALPPLTGSVTVDTVVVGMGMMGLMCAATLLARGQRVCLLEADTAGGGASGRSSGFITPDSELEFRDLVGQFGAVQGRALWEFAWGGVNAIRDLIRHHGIDCDARNDDALFVGAGRGGIKTVAGEHEARRTAGLAGELFSSGQLREVLDSEIYSAGLRFSGTFSIDAYRCCVGLRDALVAGGALACEQSPVVGLRSDGVDTPGGQVRAANVVLCTDRFLPALGLARREIYHAQTFLAITEPLSDGAVHRLFPRAPLMVWDTDLIYRYFRLTGDQRLLIGGGTLVQTYAPREKHRPETVARRLGGHLARHFPGLEVKFAACWPGLIGISKDFAPVVGQHPRWPTVSFAAGAAGLPWAAALGRYLAEALLDGRHEFDDALSVARHFPIGPRLQTVIRAPAAFAISHGIKKVT